MKATLIVILGIGLIGTGYMIYAKAEMDTPRSTRAIILDKKFRSLEYNIPHLANVEERSLIIQVDGESYSVAQLGEWTERVSLWDNESKKVAWRYTMSPKGAVRYIACCAIMKYSEIPFSSIPNNISIFDSLLNKQSDKFTDLIIWLESNAGRD